MHSTLWECCALHNPERKEMEGGGGSSACCRIALQHVDFVSEQSWRHRGAGERLLGIPQGMIT